MKQLFHRQSYHLLGYAVLGAFLLFVARRMAPGEEEILGLTARNWILFSWIFAGLFHAWILLFWRLELYYGVVSGAMGSFGFLLFRGGFIILGGSALLPLLPISRLTAGSSGLDPFLSLLLILITTPLILWGLYSVVFYFGLTRAFGADHFDPSYRSGTLEKRGIFRYIPNSMYTVVLLLLYHPALFFHSEAGLWTALAHHLFVWIHYFCTEKPDMRVIYGSGETRKG